MKSRTHDDFCYIYLKPVDLKKGLRGPQELAMNQQDKLLDIHFDYLRGELESPKQYFKKLSNRDERKITAAAIAMVCAVSTGDYETFEDVQKFCLEAESVADNILERKLSTYPQILAYVSMYAVNMIPDWIKKGDYSDFPEGLRPMMWHMYMMYLLADERTYEAYGAALAARNLCGKVKTFQYLDIYFLLFCAIGANQEGEENKARGFVKEALDLAMPYGILIPFSELLVRLRGVLEECMLEEYPQEYKKVQMLWKETIKNWIDFHNQFAKEYITKILTAQEYHVAFLLTQGNSYAMCADKMHLSVGRIKNIITTIYSKLYIKSRKELKRFVH